VVSTAGGGIFSSLTGSPTADNTVARSGAYSLRIADASAGSTMRALRSFTASSVVVTRFAVRLSSLPGVNANLATSTRALTSSSGTTPRHSGPNLRSAARL
jgi:hypothetical protein